MILPRDCDSTDEPSFEQQRGRHTAVRVMRQAAEVNDTNEITRLLKEVDVNAVQKEM